MIRTPTRDLDSSGEGCAWLTFKHFMQAHQMQQTHQQDNRVMMTMTWSSWMGQQQKQGTRMMTLSLLVSLKSLGQQWLAPFHRLKGT